MLFKKRLPKDLETYGSTTVTLGCEGCPARSAVTLAILGGISMSSEPAPIPFKVETEMHIKARGFQTFTITNEVVSLDQEKCRVPEHGSCEFGDIIKSVVAKIQSHPTALEWGLEPPVARPDE